jgi:hypothetical protein
MLDVAARESERDSAVGHVANVGDRTLLRSDATGPETIGAPLFDCTGHVVARRMGRDPSGEGRRGPEP